MLLLKDEVRGVLLKDEGRITSSSTCASTACAALCLLFPGCAGSRASPRALAASSPSASPLPPRWTVHPLLPSSTGHVGAAVMATKRLSSSTAPVSTRDAHHISVHTSSTHPTLTLCTHTSHTPRTRRTHTPHTYTAGLIRAL